MVIHLSILGVILACALIWERPIKYRKLSCIYYGERYDYKSTLTPWLIVFGYIAFLAAMRSSMNDTFVYRDSFIATSGTLDALANAFMGSDARYKLVNILSVLFKMFISDNYHWWFALFAGVESAIFIAVLRRESVSFLDSCFFFFASSLYYNYFSMMRQWIAVVLLFGGVRLIKEKKTIPFIILCIIAAQFHPSAYIMIPVYFFASGKAWSQKQNMLIGVALIAMLFLNPLLSRLASSLDDASYGYAIEAMMAGSGSSIIRAIIAAVPVVLAFVNRQRIDSENTMINACINISVINFLLNFLASFTSGLYVIRLATYVQVYNLILFPYLLNVAISNRNRGILKTGFYVIYLLFFCYQMSYQSAWGYVSDILGTFF